MRLQGAAGLLFATFLLGCGPGPTTTPTSWRLSVAKAGDGSGRITSRPDAYISCGRTCTASVARGIEVTLTATPDPGSTFEGWADGCSGTAPCVLPVNVDAQVNAVFRAKFSSITVTLEGDGEGRVVSDPAGVDCGSTCSASFKQAVPVTFRAIETPGSYFSGWRGGPCLGQSSAYECKATPESITSPIKATFTRRPPNWLAVRTEGLGRGVVRSNPPGIDCGQDCGERWNAGTVVELIAVPATGSRFDHWSDGGTDPSLLVTMADTDTNLSATFSLLKFPLTVVKAGDGFGTVTGNGIQCGADCTEDVWFGSSPGLLAVADSDSWFTGWGDPDCGRQPTCYVTVTQARAIGATFVKALRLGNPTRFGQSVAVQPDQLVAEQVVVPRAGTVRALGVIILSGNPPGRLALYSDVQDLPAALLGSTGASAFLSSGAVERELSGPLTIPAGRYWVAAFFNTTATVGAQLTGGSSLSTIRSLAPQSAFPNPFGATDAGMGQAHNLYLVLE